MRQMKIVLAVLKQGDTYLLQQRGKIKKIGGANLIGWFGGKIEEETALEAVCREVAEETTFNPDPTHAKYLGEVDVTSDHNLEHVVVNAQVYEFIIDKAVNVVAREGELVTMTLAEAMEHLDEMTTGTAAVFRELLGGK